MLAVSCTLLLRGSNDVFMYRDGCRWFVMFLWLEMPCGQFLAAMVEVRG